jgi:ABC-type bacteriocin/lantibiotic exporter with double-glycine peptidase domain
LKKYLKNYFFWKNTLEKDFYTIFKIQKSSKLFNSGQQFIQKTSKITPLKVGILAESPFIRELPEGQKT